MNPTEAFYVGALVGVCVSTFIGFVSMAGTRSTRPPRGSRRGNLSIEPQGMSVPPTAQFTSVGSPGAHPAGGYQPKSGTMGDPPRGGSGVPRS